MANYKPIGQDAVEKKNFKRDLKDFLKGGQGDTIVTIEKLHTKTLGRNSFDNEAIKLFVRDEVNVYKAFEKEFISYDAELSESIVFDGIWKTHPSTNLIIRANIRDIVLAEIEGNKLKCCYRFNSAFPEQSKFEQESHPTLQTIHEYKRRIRPAALFQSAMKGYLQIATAKAVSLNPKHEGNPIYAKDT